MREERFKHALPVLGVMRFLRGGLRGVFCPWREHAGGGAFGRGPVRATPATPVGGQVRRAGVARRGQKPLGRSPGASFLSPLSLAIQRKGAWGGAGARSPRGLSGGFPCVPCYDHGKTMETTQHATSLQTLENPPGHSRVGGHSLRSAPPLPSVQ